MSLPFKGFAPRQASIAIHSQFFSEILPQITDLAELKVVLVVYRALWQKQGEFRYLRQAELLSDSDLLQGLAGLAETPQLALEQALEKAVRDGILLKTSVNLAHGLESLYFLHTERGRTAIEQLARGEWQVNPTEQAIELLPERPNIFALYEENIGALTAGIAERLKIAEQDYPYVWIVDAINLAIDQNVRRWAYIHAILERWKQEGRSDEALEPTTESRTTKDYTGGKYADFIES